MTATNVDDTISDGEMKGFGRIEGGNCVVVGTDSRFNQQQSASASLGRGVSRVFIARPRLAGESGPSFPTPHPSSTSIGDPGKTGDSHHYKTARMMKEMCGGGGLCRRDCRHDVYVYGLDI